MKPGIKTSEFILAIVTILVLVLGAVLESGLLVEGGKWAVILAAVYGVGRTVLKVLKPDPRPGEGNLSLASPIPPVDPRASVTVHEVPPRPEVP